MNAKGKVFSGSTDVPLSDEGISATRQMTGLKIWDAIDCVYVTPLRRTKETAQLLFGGDMNYIVVPELAEVDFGDYEWKELTAESEKDPIFDKWVNNPESLTFPNGENLVKHAMKSMNALNEIMRNGLYANVAIISHATTIRMIISLILTGSIRHFRKIPCDNGCVSLITGESDNPKVKYVNMPLVHEE